MIGGVYILCDLDEIPIYVGKSKDGIRNRVRRHLTSARSDIIANRQIDVWEIAFVWTFPVQNKDIIDQLEANLFHHFTKQTRLMNGSIPQVHNVDFQYSAPSQRVQVMSDAEIVERKQPEQRLPRQANHYAQIVGHFLAVKNSSEVARAMDSHFIRLAKYHSMLLNDYSNEDIEETS